ncbi:MAG: pilus assembly protein TadG-related protein [Candidatus Limnocylindrales bacterium]
MMMLTLADIPRDVARRWSSRPRASRQRGQVLPIFAVMAAVLLGGAALLTDAAWWWVTQQQMQRAADAGALAGAVHLPGNPALAFSRALAEVDKNGFTDGVGGVVVNPRVDPVDPRKLIVDIDAPVETHFARVFTIHHVDASVVGAATYVLPVPMGSPQHYYGVGFFQGVNPASSAATEWLAPATVLSGSWNDPGNAFVDDDAYATKLSGDPETRQIYGDLGVDVPDGASITGIEARLRAHDAVDGGCAIDVVLNSPSGWTSAKRVTLGGPATEVTDPEIVGGPNDAWGASWTAPDVEGDAFRVRVQAIDPGDACMRNVDLIRLDQLELRVHYSTAESYSVLDIDDPLTGSPLASQGFWGAIFTPGGVRENGDRYAPQYIGGNNPPDGSNGGTNPDYDPNGYEYTIELGANGQVRLFDPVFCAVGQNLSGGWFGTGDHWTTDGTGGGTTIGPVSVRFQLFNTNGTPYTSNDDFQVGSTLAYDPGDATLGDFSGDFHRAGRPPQNSGRADAEDCSAHPGHNQWVLPSGWSGLPAGTYRLNVNTNLGRNADHGAENLFSVWVKGDGAARVYGGGRMAAYTNLDDTGVGGAQQFYFAQIEGVHAGKMMEITLFDPGEANADSYLRFLTPQGGAYSYATFDWYSNDGRSGTNVTEIRTAAPPQFNNRLLTINVALPADYGDGGLDPDGLGEEGWWKVEYDVRAGNDTTTWEVKLIGNPVHLVLE